MTRTRGCLTFALAPIAILIAAAAGSWLWMTLARPAIHRDPQAIPSATQTMQAAAPVDRARRLVRSAITAHNLPGLSVAVGTPAGLVWSEAFGWSVLDPRTPLTPQTRFRLGTASTVLTASAAALLLDQGRLTLDQEIQSHVPQYPKKPWPLTLRHLMSNTGGVPTDPTDDGPLALQRCDRPLDALPHFAAAPLQFEPGTQYAHSKYGWVLISAAIEAASGQPFNAFMTEHIFRPLGMDHTGAESPAEENPEHAGEDGEDAPPITAVRHLILRPLGIVSPTPRPATAPAPLYLPGFGPAPLVEYGVHGFRLRNLSCYAGSMAFYSTPSDLVRFSLALHAGKLLRPATVQLLHTSQPLKSRQPTGHGLGWDTHSVTLADEPTEAAGSDGELQGRRVASLILFRESGIVVAVMSNAPSADLPALAMNIAEAFAQPNRP